ncbi:MAG: bifunctional 2-polyprenyl-6-hydroxyphenol methylase/3-demethylubiquinol 3-O-methyltransferase UbiG, partial [Dehalococcoidia bacterium]
MSEINNAWYDDLGDAWWEPNGPLRALHEVNPVRLDYFLGVLGDLNGRRVLDLGCGGGLMTEAYARAGALTVGLDLSRPSLLAARRHARARAHRSPDYVHAPAETLPFADASFDAVCTADSLEHVAHLPAVLDECVRVLRPGGRFVFDTINRTWLSRVMFIWAAQRLLRFAPPHTHAFDRFIPPAELRRA